jgi:hypothetical protein
MREGKDPINACAAQRRQAERNLHILGDVVRDSFEARKAELKGDGKARRWFSPLDLHFLPKLGKIPISEIDQRNICDSLSPIWHPKAATAKKAIKRPSI